LEAANPIAVVLARALVHLPYHYARMALEIGPPGDGQITYRSSRRWPAPTPAESLVRFAPRSPAASAPLGTLDHFLIERYFLYTTWNGGLYRGQVHHTPYPVQSGEVHDLDESLLATAGFQHSVEVPLAHYSSGVDVEIYPIRRIADS